PARIRPARPGHRWPPAGLFAGRIGAVLRGHQLRGLDGFAVLSADLRRPGGRVRRRHPVLQVDPARYAGLCRGAVRRFRTAAPPASGPRRADGLSPAWATAFRRSTPAPATTAAPGWGSAPGSRRTPRGWTPTGPRMKPIPRSARSWRGERRL